MYIVDLVLFSLDTFLWYYLEYGLFYWLIVLVGIINLDALEGHLCAKLLATKDMEVKYKPNSFVNCLSMQCRFLSPKFGMPSMYCEHLLSIEHVQKLLYHQVDSGAGGRWSLRAPLFFMAQADKKYKAEFFPPGSEAECRISFISQSLTMEIPQPIPVDAMPMFTVLTPYYSEKVSCGVLLMFTDDVISLDSTLPMGDHSWRRPVHPRYAS